MSDIRTTDAAETGTWTFITNHAGALLGIAADPDVKLVDLARKLGITERATQRVVRDLADGGYISVERRGRRNRYTITPSSTMRHPMVGEVDLQRLIELLRVGGGPLV